MHLVFNERTKHTASWFNTLATALVTAGAFAPAAALLYGLPALPASSGRYLIALMIGRFGLGTGLHVVGVVLPGRLREWCFLGRFWR
jgi:hypothetical protein